VPKNKKRRSSQATPSSSLAHQIENGIRAHGRVREPYGPALTPEEGSIAHIELREQASLAGDWAREPVTMAYGFGFMRLGVAGDDLSSLAQLLRKREPHAFGTATLARGVVEASARGWHLFDPDIGARKRVARAMSERLYSMSETLKLRQSEARRRSTIEKMRVVATSATDHGFEVKLDKEGLPIGIDKRMPDATGVVEQAFGEAGKALYRELSAVAHGTAYGVLGRLKVLDYPVSRYSRVGIPHMSDEVLIPMLEGTLDAFQKIVDRQIEVMGWKDAPWTKWKAECAEAMARLNASA
jgi:hypothetical protein